MKRFFVCLLVATLLLSVTAIAEQPTNIADSLFLAAKTAVVDMANGDFDRAVGHFDVYDNSVTADTLRSVAETLTTLNPWDVQSDISVAYWTGGKWLLAVPVTVPDDSDVEAILFSIFDSMYVDGCTNTTWDAVQLGYESCEYVIWNKEYVSQSIFVFTD